LQPGQGVAASSSVTRARFAPHFSQKAAPANINAKQEGQLTAASRARQYGQRPDSDCTAAPQFGQWSEEASAM
jgi:hypothetical protein